MQFKSFPGFLLLGLFCLLAVRVSAQGAERIVAARVRGDVSVTIKATNARSQVIDGTEISQGSIVTTAKDSSVVLIFSNGATINLGTESTLDIEQFIQDPFSTPINTATVTEEPSKSTTKLMLTRGELVGKVAKLRKDQGSSFTVGTPVGAAGIRGTVFRVVYKPDGSGKAFFALTVQVGDVGFAFTGSVNAPASVTDNNEISGELNVQTDPATGITTVGFPNGQTLPVNPASAASMEAISSAVQQLAQTLFNSANPPAAVPPAPPRSDDVTPLGGRP